MRWAVQVSGHRCYIRANLDHGGIRRHRKCAAATLTVTNATIVSIAVTPANANVAAGTQVAYAAKGTFSDSSVVDLTTQVTWSSSVATVATINSVGVANAASPGTTVISAAFTQNGTTVTGTTNLTVH